MKFGKLVVRIICETNAVNVVYGWLMFAIVVWLVAEGRISEAALFAVLLVGSQVERLQQQIEQLQQKLDNKKP